MPADDVGRYLALVQHDLDVLRLLSRAAAVEPATDVSDWKCTLLFYMACIYVKALGRQRGQELQDHYNVKQWLNTTTDLVAVSRPYRKLEERSREARYEGRKFGPGEVAQHVRWFGEVRGKIVPLMQAGGVPTPVSVDPSAWM